MSKLEVACRSFDFSRKHKTPPFLPKDDVRDTLLRNAEVATDHFLFDSVLVPVDDFEHLVVRQFRLTGTFTPGVPVFHQHVARVVALGSQKEMIRIHTGWNIAPMKHAQAVGDSAVSDFPPNAMSVVGPTLHRDLAVAQAGPGADPQPARIGLLDFRPVARQK